MTTMTTMEVFTGLDPVMLLVAWVVVFVFGVVLNSVGAKIAEYFGTMVFLDAIGTAIGAFTCGPWMGALVGLATNIVTGWLLFRGYLYFFYVNMTCGFMWGLMYRQFVATSSDKGISDIGIILFILKAGVFVGVVSGLLSTPHRILVLRRGFKTDHLLDKISGGIITTNASRVVGWIKIVFSELLLSHLLDKLICTTVGIMVTLEINHLMEMLRHQPPSSTFNIGSLYHDLIEFLAAYYYVALAIVVKSLRVSVVDPARAGGQDEIIVLLGPLGVFAMLQGFPVFLKAIAAILLSLAGVH